MILAQVNGVLASGLIVGTDLGTGEVVLFRKDDITTSNLNYETLETPVELPTVWVRMDELQ